MPGPSAKGPASRNHHGEKMQESLLVILDNEFEKSGSNWQKSGQAQSRGLKSQCHKRLNFYSSSPEFLVSVLLDVARANDCYQVLMRNESRCGVYAAHCQFTNEQSLGDAWAKYSEHPELWTSMHDQELSNNFKNLVRDYSE